MTIVTVEPFRDWPTVVSISGTCGTCGAVGAAGADADDAAVDTGGI
jgi:hypothetical protein